MATYTPPAPGSSHTPQTPVRKKHGCFFYGCITSIIILLLAAIAITAALYWLYNKTAQYLEPQPRPIAVEQVRDDEYQALEKEVNGFLAAAQEGRPGAISLNAHQINALIARHPVLQGLRGVAHVNIKNNMIIADASIPLRKLDLPSDKYLNGSVSVAAGMQYRKPFLRIVGIEVQGKPLPGAVLQQVSETNLLHGQNVERNREAAELVDRIENIGIENGRLSISLAGRAADGEDQGTPPA